MYRRIVDQRGDQFEYSADLLTRERRMLFLRGLVAGYPGGYSGRNDPHSPTILADDILALNIEDPKKPIYMFIDSPGGEIAAGMALYDVMRMSMAPIYTVGINAASMATIILSAGHRRLLFPHSRMMLHLPSGTSSGDVDLLVIRSKELTRVKEELVDCYIECGVTAGLVTDDKIKIRKKVLKDIEKEYWLNAQEAIDYGLADSIITQEELFGNF